MKCISCGSELLENSKYCSNCGKISSPDSKAKKIKNNNLLIISVISSIIFGFFLISKSDNNSQLDYQMPAKSTELINPGIDVAPSNQETILSRLNSLGSISWSEDKSSPIDGNYPDGIMGVFLSDTCALWYFDVKSNAEYFKSTNFKDMYKEVFYDKHFNL